MGRSRFSMNSGRSWVAGDMPGHAAFTAPEGTAGSALATNRAVELYNLAAEPPLAPDELYERRWAMTLLDESLERLQLEFARAGRMEGFNSLKEWLTADRGGMPYGQIAAALGTTASSARRRGPTARTYFGRAGAAPPGAMLVSVVSAI